MELKDPWPWYIAGPLIGLWDYQEGVPGRGDAPVLAVGDYVAPAQDRWVHWQTEYPASLPKACTSVSLLQKKMRNFIV